MKNKKLAGRNPFNEDLAANRAKYGRSGFEERKDAFEKGKKRKPKKQKAKHLRYMDNGDF